MQRDDLNNVHQNKNSGRIWGDFLKNNHVFLNCLNVFVMILFLQSGNKRTYFHLEKK